MKNSLQRTVLSAILIFSAFTSCKQDYLDVTNPNQLSDNSYFKNESELQASVNSAYGAMQRLELYGRKYFFLYDLLSDDVRGNDPLYLDGQTLTAYTFLANSETVGDVWRGAYRGILRTNITLAYSAKLPKSALLDRIIAEAYFLRGLYYFELVQSWGGVPIRNEVGIASAPRATAAEVWALVEADLKKAEAALPDAYAGNDVGRATKWSAKALLGKAYLYQKKYADAAGKFKEVVDYATANPSKMGLMADYRDNFVELSDKDASYVEFNKESLFEISFGGSERTGSFNNWGQDGPGAGEGTFRAIEYGFTIFGNTSPSLDIVAAYPDSDPRKRMNMFGPGSKINRDKVLKDYDRADWQHKKYSNLGSISSSGDDVQNFAGSSINMRVIRYADVLLMYAEALNAPQNGVGTQFNPLALAALNQVRARVGLAPSAASGAADLFQAIVNERRFELWGEQVRRKDMVRWGIARNVLGNKFVTGKHELLPIPQTELDLNPGMAQNPGY